MIINNFGYAEMYEWHKMPENTAKSFGRLVQFNKELPFTIEFATDPNKIIGVSSINSSYISDDPDNWQYKYIFNEYGDIFFEQTNIACAVKEYDEQEELSYIKTFKEDVVKPVINENYDDSKRYIKRSQRPDWAKIILIGKAIVEDNGECVDGGYCTLYQGDDPEKIGTVVPAKDTDEYKLYVMNRVSDKTILVLFK